MPNYAGGLRRYNDRFDCAAKSDKAIEAKKRDKHGSELNVENVETINLLESSARFNIYDCQQVSSRLRLRGIKELCNFTLVDHRTLAMVVTAIGISKRGA